MTAAVEAKRILSNIGGRSSALLAMYGVANFFFLAPSRELIGMKIFIIANLLVAIFCCNASKKYRALYIFMALVLMSLIALDQGSSVAVRGLIFFAVFISGVLLFLQSSMSSFYLVFLIPWVAHEVFGFLQIVSHFLLFDANNVFHLVVASKLSLSIGVKYFSLIAASVIVSSYVLSNNHRFYWYTLFFSCFLIALVDNRVALITSLLSVLWYSRACESTRDAGRINKSFLGVACLLSGLLIYVYYPRLEMAWDSAVAAYSYESYVSWARPEAFYDEFCAENPLNACMVDQSIFFRISWFIFGLRVVFDYPMGIGFSDDILGRAISLYQDGFDDNFQQRDFHSELLNVSVSTGLVGVGIFLMTFSGFFAATNRLSLKKGSAESLVSALFIMWVFRFAIESIGGFGMYLHLAVFLAFAVAVIFIRVTSGRRKGTVVL